MEAEHTGSRLFSRLFSFRIMKHYGTQKTWRKKDAKKNSLATVEKVLLKIVVCAFSTETCQNSIHVQPFVRFQLIQNEFRERC